MGGSLSPILPVHKGLQRRAVMRTTRPCIWMTVALAMGIFLLVRRPAFARADVFWEHRGGAWLGRRAGAIQEELSRQGGDGTSGFFGIGVSVFGAGRSARPGAVAFEAGKR